MALAVPEVEAECLCRFLNNDAVCFMLIFLGIAQFRSLTAALPSQLTFELGGGRPEGAVNPEAICQRGGTGTLFVTHTNGGALVSSSALSSYANEFGSGNIPLVMRRRQHGHFVGDSSSSATSFVPTNGQAFIVGQGASGATYAGTFINSLPANTISFSASDNALLVLNNDLVLAKNPKCNINKPNATFCSSFSLEESTLVLLLDSDSTKVTDNNFESINDFGIDDSSNTTTDTVRNLFIESELFTMTSHSNVTFPASQLVDFNISSVAVDVDDSSNIAYNFQFNLNAIGNVTFTGRLVFSNANISKYAPLFGHEAYVNIVSNADVSVKYIKAPNIRIKGVSVTVWEDALLYVASEELGMSGMNCLLYMQPENFTCSRHDSSYAGPVFGNGTVVVTASKSLAVKSEGYIYGSVVILCSPDINIAAGATVSSTSRGCTTNQGGAAGIFQFIDVPNVASSQPSYPAIADTISFGAGGGGAAGGNGGSGTGNGSPGGASFLVDSSTTVVAGSGGGCVQDAVYGMIGAGGGIVSIMANVSLVNNGAISSIGGNGLGSSVVACGGGSGGTILVITPQVTGNGLFSIAGGKGGTGNVTAGGGGGGGNTLFFKNTKLELATYTKFEGKITNSGGAAGTTTGISLTPVATAGSAGLLPVCPLGTGNNNQTTSGSSDGSVCSPCGTGFYKSVVNSAACSSCTNNRGHSYYVACDYDTSTPFGDPQQCPTTASCPYVCDAGDITQQCLNPFLLVIFVLGSWACTAHQAKETDLVCIWGGFVVDFVAVIIGIFLCLRLYRYREYRKFVDDMNKDRQNLALLGHQQTSDPWAMGQPASGESLVSPLFQPEIQMQTSSFSLNKRTASTSASNAARKSMFHYLKASAKNPKDLRLAMRMVDADMTYHACRIYLLGSNHPHLHRGGNWHLDRNRPTCLRPMLKRTEYQKFADMINREMEWNTSSWDWLIYHVSMFFINIFMSPLTAMIQVRVVSHV